jgi:CyaY protein
MEYFMGEILSCNNPGAFTALRGQNSAIPIPSKPLGINMNETDFLRLTNETLARIEQGLEDAGLDFESPADGILEIEFDNDSKMVINRHNVAQEIWVAARSGGFHFRHDGQVWRDTRDNTELLTKLTALISLQGGVAVSF